jgi:hypothetical protein
LSADVAPAILKPLASKPYTISTLGSATAACEHMNTSQVSRARCYAGCEKGYSCIAYRMQFAEQDIAVNSQAKELGAKVCI